MTKEIKVDKLPIYAEKVSLEVGNLTLKEGELKEELTIQKIYKAGFTWFYVDANVYQYFNIGYFQKKEDAEKAIEEDKKVNTYDKPEHCVTEIEVK